MRTLLVVLVAATTTACAPVLHLRRPTPPDATFGTVRTMAVSVKTDVARAVDNAVATGILAGELPLPVPADQVLRGRLIERLEQLGYAVCPAAPCGDGELEATMLESAVGTRFTQNGVQATVRLRARVKVRQANGEEPYDYTFWDSRSGDVANAPHLVLGSANAMVNSLERTLQPGWAHYDIPLEGGGLLDSGVRLLKDAQWQAAIAYFSDLVARQPNFDGAWYDLGVAWEGEGDWAQALAAYQRAADLNPRRNYTDAVANALRYAPRSQPTPVKPLP